MDRNKEVDESDDFDIYADLDDHNIAVTDDNDDHSFVFPDTALTSNSNLGQNVGQRFESKEEVSEPKEEASDDMASDDRKIAQTVDDFEEYVNSSEVKCDDYVSNDLILNEISILETNLHKTQDMNKNLGSKNEELNKQLEIKDKQLLVLKRNISSLFKTAKAEIARHKREVDELRQELDSMIFRRLPRKEPKVQESIVTNVELNTQNKTFTENSSQTNDRDFTRIVDISKVSLIENYIFHWIYITIC